MNLFKNKCAETDLNDFDALFDRIANLPDQERYSILWSNAFRLEKWYFLTKPIPNMEQAKPFFGEIDGKGWVFAFTDSSHVRKFAEIQGFTTENGGSYTIVMNTDKAVDWVLHLLESGVFGIRFNEGSGHGWFGPIENIPAIVNYLIENKYLK